MDDDPCGCHVPGKFCPLHYPEITHRIEVPINGSVHVAFLYEGEVVAEAAVRDEASELFSGKLNPGERELVLEAGPTDTDGEFHGADDGGEAWFLRMTGENVEPRRQLMAEEIRIGVQRRMALARLGRPAS